MTAPPTTTPPTTTPPSSGPPATTPGPPPGYGPPPIPPPPPATSGPAGPQQPSPSPPASPPPVSPPPGPRSPSPTSHQPAPPPHQPGRPPQPPTQTSAEQPVGARPSDAASPTMPPPSGPVDSRFPSGTEQFMPTPGGQPSAGNPPFSPQPFGPQQFGPQGFGQQSGGSTLDSDALLRKARRAPRSGWRRTVHKVSGGAINPGDSQQTVYFDQLVRQVNAPVRGDFRIAVLSLKGGVGKTTTTVGLGSTFADLRGDRVIAIDANPDLGTLAQRVRLQTGSTVRDVLLDDSIFRYSDIRRHTSQAASRLEVLASERDPATAETFGEQDYRSVMRILQRYYNIILTDCGTGLSHSAMAGVLDLAQSLILVSTPAIDGARSASATLDWLEAHGYGHLVSRAVVVLSGPRRKDLKIDLDQLGQHFLARTRAVQIIPFDDHLAEGAEVDLAMLDKATRRSYVELAATVAEDFALTDEPEDRLSSRRPHN
ncbi:MinD/ParA family ATP-binding protein [Gordonia sp. CPCC 206044]|uniref:MinD/ParA family ATP-binding protein n=1 Tax=Gordonia sp. CPCC 206044 TaxID=3140793 RepID=UPI003AF37BAA